MMKKLLLTSALVAGFASASLADAPAVTVGGRIDFRGVYMKQSDQYKNVSTKQNKSQTMSTLTRLTVKTEGKTDFGLTYGGLVELGDRGSDTSGNTPEFRATWLYMESALGRVVLGSHDAATRSMRTDASRIAGGTGGIDGDANNFIDTVVGYIEDGNTTTGDRTTAKYVTVPMMPLDSVGAIGARYNKVTYYTPEISGFQVGISYGADTSDRFGHGSTTSDYLSITTASNVTSYANIAFNDAISVAARYKYQMDQVGFVLNGLGQFAKPKAYTISNPQNYQQLHDIKAYGVGASVSYANYTFAGSYGNWGKSMNSKVTDIYNRAKSHYYTAGAAYTQGPVGLSATYMTSSRMKNKYKMTSLAADYKLAPGLVPYLEANFGKFKPEAAVTQAATGSTIAVPNKTRVVFVGAKLNF